MDHLKARSTAELQNMARRAVICLQGSVLPHRKAGHNLINGLHREVINLSQAQLSGCVRAHAHPMPHWMSVPRRSGALTDAEVRNGPRAVADVTTATIAVAITLLFGALAFCVRCSAGDPVLGVRGRISHRLRRVLHRLSR